MSNIHVVQAGLIKPLLNHLEDAGSGVGNIIKRSGLNFFNLEKGDNYVPLNSMYMVLEEYEKQFGTSAVLKIMTKPTELLGVSRFMESIFSQPDLLSAFRFASQFDMVFQSNEKIDLTIDGKAAKFSFSWADAPSRGRALNEIYDLNLVVMAVGMAVDHNYVPSEIHFVHDFEPDLDQIFPDNQTTKVYLNQPTLAISFPIEKLISPFRESVNDGGFKESHGPTSYNKRISLLLESNRPAFVPGLKHLADMIGMSTRTLQRTLHTEGTSFEEIVDHWRFKKALELIRGEHIAIKEISQHLGYTNVPAFYRAFQRWTNMTPVQFRESL